MKKYIYLIAIVVISVVAGGCKSYQMPTTEESKEKIKIYTAKTDSIERVIASSLTLPAITHDMVIFADLNMINRITRQLSNQREDDIKLYFRKKGDFMKEDKNVLGIKYTNYLSIDTGYVAINLKKLNLDKMDNSKINATLELEGKGGIAVSGKYTGIPASASPDVQIYMIEPIAFDLQTTNDGNVLFKPLPRKMLLKTKFAISLLEWKVPYYQEVELELTQLMQPMKIPLAFSGEISLPKPAQNFSGQRMEFVPYKVELRRAEVKTSNNKIDFRSDVEFIKK